MPGFVIFVDPVPPDAPVRADPTAPMDIAATYIPEAANARAAVQTALDRGAINSVGTIPLIVAQAQNVKFDIRRSHSVTQVP